MTKEAITKMITQILAVEDESGQPLKITALRASNAGKIVVEVKGA